MIDKLELEMKTERLADGTYVVSVAGELDLHTSPEFEKELRGALDNDPEALIVDLSACEFFDSTALGVLLGVRKAVADSAGALALVAPPDTGIRRVFELSGCEGLFSLHATRVAAMNGGVHVANWVDAEARTRALFRVVNERIAELGDGLELAGRRSYVCECGNGDCLERVELTRDEYESVRAHGRRFVLAVDHENPSLEIVVSENGRYAIGETLVGETSRIPEDTNPRRRVGVFAS